MGRCPALCGQQVRLDQPVQRLSQGVVLPLLYVR